MIKKRWSKRHCANSVQTPLAVNVLPLAPAPFWGSEVSFCEGLRLCYHCCLVSMSWVDSKYLPFMVTLPLEKTQNSHRASHSGNAEDPWRELMVRLSVGWCSAALTALTPSKALMEKGLQNHVRRWQLGWDSYFQEGLF